jgi:uncharacterized protein
MIISNDNALDFGLSNVDYRPQLLFKNHHFNTMYPYAMRKRPTLPFQRERFFTQDGDFLDLDYIKNNSDKIIVLLHGLEGSSGSQYIQGLSSQLYYKNYDVCAVNHRSCSGEMNKKMTMYHSGYIEDLIEIVNYLSPLYREIHLVGYSLGGSMVLNYLGRYDFVPSNVKSAVTFSVPIDLSSSATMLNHWKNRPYAIQFLMTLNKKIIEKAKQFPDSMNANDYKKIKTLIEYDNKVTAPLHGFDDAEDYYQKASSRPYLEKITIPTLLVNAHDDSFLAPPCYPYDIAKNHKNFHFIGTKYGGHVGFANFVHDNYWSDRVVIDWLENTNVKSFFS